ncbi:katanin p60 ATPase-containing subunit A-like 2 isoform X2 [Halyomorpha halys]|uniref:katanin p60 ATPase-containing subunit A-like 2 isoform X2 n=1 Tax=Halyomorpha halys TaxID=286706 RepID=UPI0006D5285F|nr:katanin p60 ATPase-containing subunit A-like 2 isoform X2 [Halyomorpha halys]
MYTETYQQFNLESKLPKDLQICDNIELSHILQEYETYYFIRFQKYPKISKKIIYSETEEKKNQSKQKKKVPKTTSKASSVEKIDSLEPLLNPLVVVPIPTDGSKILNESYFSDEKIFKPLGSFEGYSDEWKSFADIIMKEVVDKNLNVDWDDVIGLNDAKTVLKEAIVYPNKYPDFFEEFITPWKGLLLFGPSGTGKTMLAKAVATQNNMTFFNISASSIVSKWRGESEKLVRVMFDLARLQAPSTIFIDELDAIASQRDSNREHEASRRLKSELLVQLDGLCQSNENVFFLTATNLPWDLDTAILRRLEKRIFVDLPDLNSRKSLIEKYLPPVLKPSGPLIKVELNYSESARKCEGYSAFDIKLLCKEISMNVVRSIFKKLEEGVVLPRFIEEILEELPPKKVSATDFDNALEKVKATAVGTMKKFKSWEKEFGSF